MKETRSLIKSCLVLNPGVVLMCGCKAGETELLINFGKIWKHVFVCEKEALKFITDAVVSVFNGLTKDELNSFCTQLGMRSSALDHKKTFSLMSEAIKKDIIEFRCYPNGFYY